jgi:uncharacterized protein Veg
VVLKTKRRKNINIFLISQTSFRKRESRVHEGYLANPSVFPIKAEKVENVNKRLSFRFQDAIATSLAVAFPFMTLEINGDGGF